MGPSSSATRRSKSDWSSSIAARKASQLSHRPCYIGGVEPQPGPTPSVLGLLRRRIFVVVLAADTAVVSTARGARLHRERGRSTPPLSNKGTATARADNPKHSNTPHRRFGTFRQPSKTTQRRQIEVASKEKEWGGVVFPQAVRLKTKQEQVCRRERHFPPSGGKTAGTVANVLSGSFGPSPAGKRRSRVVGRPWSGGAGWERAIENRKHRLTRKETR